MGKRTGENQDFYKGAGQRTGRRVLAKERQKLSESRAEAPTTAAPHYPSKAAKATGAGTQTQAFARRARERKQAQRVEHEEVERMVSAVAPTASPTRMLPPAQPSTELADLWRSLEENAGAARESARTVAAAGRDLWRSVRELLRAPVRLARLAWAAGA